MAQIGSGTSYSVASPGALVEASEEIARLCEQAVCWGPVAAPGVLRELHAAIGQALGLGADDQAPGCRYGCTGHGLHCPIAEPPERMLADLQRRGWVAEWDCVEARLAQDQVCVCGTRMFYVALRPGDGVLATAWAICPTCRHWAAL